MSKEHIFLVAGARPNFMKIAPIVRALDTANTHFRYTLVHTGQHYDREMNDVFFEELGIPQPDIHLGAGGGSHAEQTARIMLGFEQGCLNDRPDLVLVVGDVNSTLACSITAKKLGIDVAHVEAGLRSGDRSMPEEINRIVTDSISDLFFASERAGVDNLLLEGKPRDKVHFVGHVMIDNLMHQVAQLDAGSGDRRAIADLKAELGSYGVVTLHRPANVDNRETLEDIVGALRVISRHLPLVFPVHPRTRANLDRFGIDVGDRIELTPPLSYMDFLSLWRDARIVLTDSGGLQEETTALGVPCITIRDNTERPITVEEGTNVLAGTNPDRIVMEAMKANSRDRKVGRQPEFWDGRAAERIIEILIERKDLQ
jgi:UDP-N-acetylglucosamine 2-epimerase (non-hydrolysing)